jgi:hypothetical protein
MNETNKSQLDDWLKKLSWLAVVGVFIVLFLIGLYFYSTIGVISKQQNDWAAFGSFLSGVFSFLGAIGTVGVMLLGIKQFKVQQDQINAQTERQNSFEEKQEEKWAKENEILNFQKYRMHVSEFNNLLEGIEKDHHIIFKNKYGLYNQLFPNNNSYHTSFSVANEQSLISFLENYLKQFYTLAYRYKKLPNACDFNNMIGLVGAINNALNIDFIHSESDEKNQLICFGINIKKIQSIIDIGVETILKLSQLTSFKLQFKYIVGFKNKAFIDDVSQFATGHGSNVNGTFLEFLILLQVAIKHDRHKYTELYKLSEYTFKSIDLFSIHTQFETYTNLVLVSGLKSDEKHLLVGKLRH